MAPVITKSYSMVGAMIEHEQVKRLEAIRRRLVRAHPGRRVSRSDVIREVLAKGLLIVEGDLEDEEPKTPVSQMTAGP